MKSIYLTGFMGAGKTTVGEKLGKALQLEVYDTDQVIEKKTGISIKELFSTKGESYFRTLEEQTLQEMPIENAIITTGGGIVLSERNRNWMKGNGIRVFLFAEMDIVWERLKNDQTRPIIQQKKKEEVANIFQQRLPLYNQAEITVDTTYLSLEAAVEAVYHAVKTYEKRQH
ncbi:Shikimate kinase [Bacillus sp. THAF10]|uniref:shikimate kinase n=1 Tax=Bacillus sp. THAF10 TaxID=2587848 RepID=UPI0012679743|nr:shikimate kinase [Bacillus sp. THAF10]QFT89790.1 Shikimate kinase [Bacillus sp. THAF10]